MSRIYRAVAGGAFLIRQARDATLCSMPARGPGILKKNRRMAGNRSLGRRRPPAAAACPSRDVFDRASVGERTNSTRSQSIASGLRERLPFPVHPVTVRREQVRPSTLIPSPASGIPHRRSFSTTQVPVAAFRTPTRRRSAGTSSPDEM